MAAAARHIGAAFNLYFPAVNFLAHLYLSRHHENLMIGNFIADGVKGKRYLDFEKDIAEGILMHRAIDTFTDAHPVTTRSKSLLRPFFHHSSGIILDVFYDYYLARDWPRYAEGTLEEFTRRCYRLFHRREDILPERNRRILRFMEQNNWLLSYAQPEGIGRALEGMSQRVHFKNNMQEALPFLLQYEAELGADFHEFFPLLIRHLQGLGYYPEASR